MCTFPSPRMPMWLEQQGSSGLSMSVSNCLPPVTADLSRPRDYLLCRLDLASAYSTRSLRGTQGCEGSWVTLTGTRCTSTPHRYGRDVRYVRPHYTGMEVTTN